MAGAIHYSGAIIANQARDQPQGVSSEQIGRVIHRVHEDDLNRVLEAKLDHTNPACPRIRRTVTCIKNGHRSTDFLLEIGTRFAS
jgi:hypothetical protein